ncbi:hypothetical protein [Roseinatronobacter sp.]
MVQRDCRLRWQGVRRIPLVFGSQAPNLGAFRIRSFDLPDMIVASLSRTSLLLTRPMIGQSVGLAMLAGYVAYVWAVQA